MAAFTNGTMVRFLDISDTYMGQGGGHPSDVTAGILAVAEAVQADGKSVMNAIVLAYDIYCSLNDAVDIGAKGWDQTLYAVLGAVLGIGRLINLTREQLGHAVALALAPNLALRQTRVGDLSSWKGCAGANAVRNAVFAATLAQAGFTGPSDVFEGKYGLWNALGPFDWRLPASGASRMITQTHLKSLPVCYHGQSAVLCALELRSCVPTADIAEIRVEAYGGAVAMMGGDPSRWAPASRETADHSMPYVIAKALLDGAVTVNSFESTNFTAPAVVALMRKVKVAEDTALSRQYPEGAPGRVTIVATNGQEFVHEIKYPAGHAKNPLSDADLEKKFHELMPANCSSERRGQLLNALRSFEHVTDIRRDVIGLLAAG
jgi:2-methylcitrate dehydratase